MRPKIRYEMSEKRNILGLHAQCRTGWLLLLHAGAEINGGVLRGKQSQHISVWDRRLCRLKFEASIQWIMDGTTASSYVGISGFRRRHTPLDPSPMDGELIVAVVD
jgi:hypothetical protein